MRTDDLITLLAQDSAVRWKFGRVLGLATLIGIAIAGMAFFLGIGFRADISHAMETVRFLFKFVVTIALAVAATGTVWRIAQPGAPLRPWGWTLAAAPALLACAVIAELVVMPASSWGTRLVGSNMRFCLTLIPLLSIGPLACFLVALRQGAPGRPGLAGAIAGLAASGIAATFYAANCTDDSPLFVAAWYPVAVAMVTLAGYLLGRRLLRW